MAEDTEHTQEPSPLSEEEVEALSEKFTASWEASDSTHAGPGGAALPPGGAPGRRNLKRTMLGMPPFSPDPPPAGGEGGSPPIEPTSDVIDEEALPRQKTLLGLQAPDPSLVQQVAEAFVTSGSAPLAPSSSAGPVTDPSPSEAQPPIPLVQVASELAQESHSSAASHITPAVAPLEAPGTAEIPVDTDWPEETPAPALSATPPEPEITVVPATPERSGASSLSTETPAPGPAPQGPGLFGWGEPPAAPVKLTAGPARVEASAPPAPTPSSRMVTVRMGSMTATEPAAAASPGDANRTPATEPPGLTSAVETHQTIEAKQREAAQAVFPEESTLPTGVAPGKPPSPAPSSPLQSYAPPVAPPPALGSSPTNEKTIVIDDESSRSPEDEARAIAMRLAQRADTLPPQRPRLDIEIPPELQRRSGTKAGLWVAGLLSLVIGGGAVFALSGGTETPSLSAEKSAAVNAVTPDPSPAPDKPMAGEPARDEATPEATANADEAEDGVPSGDSQASEPAAPKAAVAAAPKPKPVTTTATKPATTTAKKPTAVSKTTTTQPSKTTKPKKATKPASKTIVRDAPF